MVDVVVAEVLSAVEEVAEEEVCFPNDWRATLKSNLNGKQDAGDGVSIGIKHQPGSWQRPSTRETKQRHEENVRITTFFKPHPDISFPPSFAFHTKHEITRRIKHGFNSVICR
jgi:hypothetical protein